MWGKAGGRQHAGGLARSVQGRSTQVMAVSQEGGIEVTLGHRERRMSVGLDSRHFTHPTPTPTQEKKNGKEGRLGHLTSGPDAALGLGVFNQGGFLWCHCPAHVWTRLGGDPHRDDLGTFVGRLDNPGECA